MSTITIPESEKVKALLAGFTVSEDGRELRILSFDGVRVLDLLVGQFGRVWHFGDPCSPNPVPTNKDGSNFVPTPRKKSGGPARKALDAVAVLLDPKAVEHHPLAFGVLLGLNPHVADHVVIGTLDKA